MLSFFEEELPEGWVYPCTLGDISRMVERLDPECLEGLNAIGLARRDKRHTNANAVYNFSQKRIAISPYPAGLRYRQPQGVLLHHIENGMRYELDFGMKAHVVGSRIECEWDAPNLSEFIVWHVLLHEIGHHVYCRDRHAKGYVFKPYTRESEQYAEAFAVRVRRELGRP